MRSLSISVYNEDVNKYYITLIITLKGHIPEPSMYPECSRVIQCYHPEAEGWRGCQTQEKCRCPLGHPQDPKGPVTSDCKAVET